MKTTLNVVDVEYLPWCCQGLSGTGPIKLLIDDGQIVQVNPGLGLGYWDRARELLEEKVGTSFPKDQWPKHIRFLLT